MNITFIVGIIAIFGVINLSPLIYFIFYCCIINLNYWVVSLKPMFINFSLIYGLVSVHPIVFYSSFIMCCFFIFFNIYILTVHKFYYTTNFILFCLSFLTGGFWSLFYFFWGFFWVFDIIEYFPFLLSITCIFFLHKFYSISIHNYTIFLSLTIIVLLFSIRYGFLITRHSFFNTFNIKLFFVYLLVLFTFACFYKSSYCKIYFYKYCSIFLFLLCLLILINLPFFFLLFFSILSFSFRFKIKFPTYSFHIIVLFIYIYFNIKCWNFLNFIQLNFYLKITSQNYFLYYFNSIHNCITSYFMSTEVSSVLVNFFVKKIFFLDILNWKNFYIINDIIIGEYFFDLLIYFVIYIVLCIGDFNK